MDKLKAQLDDLSSRGYTELYPEVRKLTKQIAQKEKSLADLKADAPTSSGGPPASTTPNAASGDAPATIPQEGPVKAKQAEIADRKRIAALKAEINDYQGRLNQRLPLNSNLRT